MVISADEINWTLSRIRSKVRRLTGRPSANQISNDEVDLYINRFYQYDLISALELRELEEIWRFETMVNVPSYSVDGEHYGLDGPIYVNGTSIPLFNDPTPFFARHPGTFSTRESVGSGDGATSAFSGTLNKSPVDPENIIIDDDSEVLRVQNRPVIDTVTNANPAVVNTKAAHGLTTGDTVRIVNLDAGMVELNNVQTTITRTSSTAFQLDNIDSTNFTSYTTSGEVFPTSVAILEGDQGGSGRVTVSSGAFSITFNTAPADGQDIVASYEYVSVGTPVAALAYDEEILFSPTPDGSYFIQVQTTRRPEPLLSDNDSVESDSWGKLIAYGASIDIMNDNGQQEGAALLEREFRLQQMYALRGNIRNNTNERAAPRF